MQKAPLHIFACPLQIQRPSQVCKMALNAYTHIVTYEKDTHRISPAVTRKCYVTCHLCVWQGLHGLCVKNRSMFNDTAELAGNR